MTQHSSPCKMRRLNLNYLALVFVMLVAIAVGLIGIANRGTTPWILALPLMVAAWGITHLRDE